MDVTSTPFAYMSSSNKYSEKANSEFKVNGRKIRLKKVDQSQYIYFKNSKTGKRSLFPINSTATSVRQLRFLMDEFEKANGEYTLAQKLLLNRLRRDRKGAEYLAFKAKGLI